MKKVILFSTILFAAGLAVGCSSAGKPPYSEQYSTALATTASPSESQADLTAFRALFSDLAADDVAAQTRQVYAPTLYFNDTLHTFENHDDLAAYLAATGERADLVEIAYLDQWQRGSDVYLRWRMRTVFSVLGKQRDITSYGISHLRLNPAGQVVLHQDYWDSSEGLLRHLPVSGPAINWIRKRL